jgi:ribonucleoside-diphosphate reductase alpha chain
MGKTETAKREPINLVGPAYFSSKNSTYAPGFDQYEKRSVLIKDDSGNVVEELGGIMCPVPWSQIAIGTAATKYFRKEGVPLTGGREVDVRQLTGRVAQALGQWGKDQGYFNSRRASTFTREDEAITRGQMGAFNSPVWFNVGLDQYGIEQEGNTFYVDLKTGEPIPVENFYENPQGSACFIAHPSDSIEDMMRVFATFSSELFRNGSGIGSSMYQIRSEGEPISGGGIASGAKRFADVQDAVARVIKSGGKTRRAAVLQNLPIWHADALGFVRDKYQEELKAKVLIEAGSPNNWESHTIQNLRSQNANISILVDKEFWDAYEADGVYNIRAVRTGEPIRQVKARDYLEQLAFATHGCGDPGIQNFDIMNEYNTCKNSGDIWGSNPCSEFMFLNNTACNLASINLMKFRNPDGSFDFGGFNKVVDHLITAQDIFVSKFSYPSKEIALNSHRFRPLGLGFANLGAYIMANGEAYDSEGARMFGGAVASAMSAEAYLQSTKLAEVLGPFEEFEKNREPMLEVIEKHRKSSHKLAAVNGLEHMVRASQETWEEALRRGEKHGFRNGQVTLLAPTGTTGLMMDCDTTGGEPVYQLKVYKELAGGGAITIVNQTVPLALKSLGYLPGEIDEIVKHIDKTGTAEGAPNLREKDLAVFDCAVTANEGTRAIAPMGHLRMMGAMQPFLSGAISKTVNCPNNTSVEEIQEMMYQSHELGLKAVAIYRDGSKAAQPLSTGVKKGLDILVRGEREPLPDLRYGITQKLKVGGISMFLRSGEYEDGRLGELFLDSLERGSGMNKALHENVVQFSEKLQYGMPLEEALEVFRKAGESQLSGFTDHPFIKQSRGWEGFLSEWVSAHYLGDISGVSTILSESKTELRPFPWELRVYQQKPKLHLMPSVAGVNFYEGVPTLEETIQEVSGTNFWLDEKSGLDTRKTIERIKKERKWNKDTARGMESQKGKITGRTCDGCGGMLISDGKCWKCPSCKTAIGGCSG